jgi:hypothetical protein
MEALMKIASSSACPCMVHDSLHLMLKNQAPIHETANIRKMTDYIIC